MSLTDRKVYLAAILFALAFYARSFHAYFVADDYEFAGKMDVHKASRFLFTKLGYNEYRPVVPLIFAASEAVGSDTPLPFHITNTLLHAANACLLFSIAVAAGFPRTAAIFALGAFLVNPLAHEPLLWISGLPVLLGALFVLLAVRLFLTDRIAAPVGVVVCYLFGLGTYEGAIVLPFVLAAICALPRYRCRGRLATVLVLFAVAAVYVILWLRLSEFHIVRFAVEHSLFGMAWDGWQALSHSLHGSLRLLPGLLYAVVLIHFCRTARGRRISLFLLGLFVIGYSPFFLVHGFANRFAYLSSTAALLCFASALVELRPSTVAALSAVAVLVFFGIGMQSRITSWNRAGEIARIIPAQIRALAPALPAGSTIAIENVPAMYRQAYVFISGLDSAMERAYGEPLHVVDKAQSGNGSRVFRWTGERIIEIK